ncbi:MAG: hypothetical protein IH789_07010 [Acidobacteria bacterium]|nr:hypothetical protein [Acidobacteriota bacterium]
MKAGRKSVLALGALLLAATPGPVSAQQTDYLTRDEVTEVREAQEPVKRVSLFLNYADLRLAVVEKILEAASGGKPPRGDDLQDAMNNYIRAIDDAAANLEIFLERGGVDLRKLRQPLRKIGTDLLARLKSIQPPFEGARTDLRWDMEDALETTQDLLTLEKQIPDQPIPPKIPTLVGAASEKEKTRVPGQPTLKRKKEKPPQE